MRPSFQPDRLARLRDWADAYVEREELPCIAVLVGDRDGDCFEHYSGVAGPSAGVIGPDTLLRIYSMTKPVTGVALLQLVEEGALHLDDPIGAYLPELADLRVLTGGSFHGIDSEPARPVTIRHLATHTSGMTYDFFPHDPVASLYRDAGVTGGLPAPKHGTLEQWTRALGQLPLGAQPGVRWQYSVGMDVLGRLVEVLRGRRFGEVGE